MARAHLLFALQIAKALAGSSSQIDLLGETTFVKTAPATVFFFKNERVAPEAAFYGLIGIKFYVAAADVESQNIQVAVAVNIVNRRIVNFTHKQLGTLTTRSWDGKDIKNPVCKFNPLEGKMPVFRFSAKYHDAIHARYIRIGKYIHDAIAVVIAQEHPVLHRRKMPDIFRCEAIG